MPRLQITYTILSLKIDVSTESISDNGISNNKINN